MKKLITILFSMLLFSKLEAQVGTIPPGGLPDPTTSSENGGVIHRSMLVRVINLENWLRERDKSCGKILPEGDLVQIYTSFAFKYGDWRNEFKKGNSCQPQYGELDSTFRCYVLSRDSIKKLKEARATLSDPKFVEYMKKERALTEQSAKDLQEMFQYLLRDDSEEGLFMKSKTKQGKKE